MTNKARSKKKGRSPEQMRHEAAESTAGAIPPGAQARAAKRDERPGGPRHTPLRDRYAAGTPGGGTEYGGLAGGNAGEGEIPDEEILDAALAGGEPDPEAEEEDAYSGFSGGAVGGTPAGKRSPGGKQRKGLLRPGSTHRGDSTIGGNPETRE
jgi:hypothetical protein